MLSTLRWALPFWRRPFPYSQSTITGTTGARRKVLIQGETIEAVNRTGLT